MKNLWRIWLLKLLLLLLLLLYSKPSPFWLRIAFNRTFVARSFFNTCQREILFCVQTEVQGKPWKISKILRGRNSRRGAFFEKKISIPGTIANHPKLLDLVSTKVGLNHAIQISAGLFITAKYQHSQNRQNLSTRANNKTLAQEETFQQLSLKGRVSTKLQPISIILPCGEIFLSFLG